MISDKIKAFSTAETFVRSLLVLKMVIKDMIQDKNSNAKQMTVPEEREEELRILKDAYEKMTKHGTGYNKVFSSEKHIKRVQEIAKKYKLPIICPSADSKGNPSFILNGCFERFKGPDRWTLFTKSYRNIPMFYKLSYRWALEPNYEWYLGQDYSWGVKPNYIFYLEDNKFKYRWYLLKQEEGWCLEPEKEAKYFLHESFLRKNKQEGKQEDEQIITGKNPAVFKNDVHGERIDLGKQNVFDIFGKGTPSFYNRNEFIEGICKKKRKGRTDVRDFLKKHLLPIDEFDLKLTDFLRSPEMIREPEFGPSFDPSIDNINLIIKKFHKAIKDIGITLIKCDGKDCLWYEDYAIIPSISIDLSEIGHMAPYHLPISFFFCSNNNSVIWQYIFLNQSGLLRSAVRMKDQTKIPFLKSFYDSVSPVYRKEKDMFGNEEWRFYYPIFQVKEGGIITVIDLVSLYTEFAEILELRVLSGMWNDIYKNNEKQLPKDWQNILRFMKRLSHEEL